MSSAKTTTNHDEIRRWVEKRGGHPAVVAATENSRGRDGGLLRIDYDEPGGNDDNRLHRISWDEFFRIFDDSDIAFLRRSGRRQPLQQVRRQGIGTRLSRPDEI
jgi:hypothetical protein